MAIRNLKPAAASGSGAGLPHRCTGDLRRLLLLFSLTLAVLLVWLIPADRDASPPHHSAEPALASLSPNAGELVEPVPVTMPHTAAPSTPAASTLEDPHAWAAEGMADSAEVVMGTRAAHTATDFVTPAEDEPLGTVPAELTPAEGWGPLSDDLAGLPACTDLPAPCTREGCGFSPMHPCVNGCACPAPQCIVVNSTACLRSPFWVRFARASAEGRFPIEDGRCMADATRGAAVEEDSGTKLASDGGPTTGGRQKSLFPIAGLPLLVGADGGRVQCAEESEHAAFAYEGHGDGVHTFRNVCVRDAGPLARFRSGGTPPTSLDLGLEHGGFADNKVFNGWAQATNPFSTGTDCLLPASSRPALFFPVAPPADNHMHVMHRFAAAARFLRDKYGDGFRSQVIVVYVIARRAKKQLAVLNAYATFYRMLSETWLEVMVSAPGGPGRPPIACFEVAHMLTLSKKQSRKKPRRSSREPVIADGAPDPLNGTPLELANSGVAFPMFGFRSEHDVATAQLMKQLMHRCFTGNEPRTGPASDKPRLVIAWRTITRRFAGFAVLLPLIALHWRRLGGGDVRVVEHVGHDPARLVRLHAGADVVAGMIGTGLMWGALVPPGGVVVEFGRDYGCASIRRAYGWNESQVCEYGGNAVAFNHHHLSATLPFAAGGQKWEYVPLEWWHAALNASLCRLRTPEAPCRLPEMPPPVALDKETRRAFQHT